jgi:hypothetical protein
METEVYNPYNSLSLAQRLLNRRLHNTSNRLQNSLSYSRTRNGIVDRVLHRRQNRFANLNRFGEQFVVNFPINESNINLLGSIGGVATIDSSFLSLREFVEIDATIKIQRWYKRYMHNKKYIKKYSLDFVDR